MKNYILLLLLVSCHFDLVSQSGLLNATYSDTYQTDQVIVQSSAKLTVCAGIRSDIMTDLNSNERQMLADLILEYLQEIENPSYDVNDEFYLKYDRIAQHSDYGNVTTAGATSGSGIWHSDNEEFFYLA